MRYIFFKLFLLIIIISAFRISSYSQISSEEILIASKNFLSNKKDAAHLKINSLPTTLFDENGLKYAIILDLSPQGFIAFSPTKDIYPIISFSFKNDFVYNSNNPLFDLLKSDMTEQLSFIATESLKGKSNIISQNKMDWEKILNESNSKNMRDDYDLLYGPLLETVWGGVNCKDQDSNYIYVGNYFTPNHYSPGCVGTAMSQVMHYYNWPTTGIGSHTDYDNNGSSQGSYYADFENANYDWPNMLNEYMYLPSTDTERRAMGKLAYHCGVSVDMDYENNGSTSNINRSPAAYDNYFRFSGHHKTSSWSSFWSRMDENIENGHPVQLALGGSGNTGHAPVCDGYREDTLGYDRYYHLDMGWWGSYNAWYRIQGSFSAGGYTSVDAAVFDILPDPIMNDPVINSSSNFTLSWTVASNFTWDAFELQESYNGGSYVTLDNNITQQSYSHTVSGSGTYKYRVRAKSDGYYYADSYSEPVEIQILQSGEIVFLSFDGTQKSFFVNDNPADDLDVSNEWTFETWIKVDNQTINNVWPVIMDRRTVFTLYLITDSNANDDYAFRFVARSSNDSIIASLRSDNSSQNIKFGDWVHIAVTRNLTRANGSTRLYINGIEVDSSSNNLDFNLSASTNAINFGARYWGNYERFFKGSLDEIRISNISRYSSNFTPNRESLFISDVNTILLMHLNEGYGLDISDSANRFSNISLRSNPNDPTWNLEVLPILYLDELNLTKDKLSVFLEWSTVFEINNSRFEIQRSINSEVWEKIGIMSDPITTHHNIKEYKFTDKSPYNGQNYYRLKQIDNDGSYSFSKIKTIQFNNFNGIQIYPNPTDGKIYFRENLDISSIKVFNVTGSYYFKYNTPSNFIDISELPKGIYYLQFDVDNKIITEKIIKQ